ncbi:hypothetical protein BC936DRAFT_140241 [Jimgerdemannia flammicorona]|uniref:Uncharacterized protein n=1 Tax=Jimgerdemannia flammicorona TaxID=994334 RepID=A0A433AVQ8_9FUNG|nr:hypothetical protein BC936DRAFT_140241 [Jimgerdemannia flammicorona]
MCHQMDDFLDDAWDHAYHKDSKLIHNVEQYSEISTLLSLVSWVFCVNGFIDAYGFGSNIPPICSHSSSSAAALPVPWTGRYRPTAQWSTAMLARAVRTSVPRLLIRTRPSGLWAPYWAGLR